MRAAGEPVASGTADARARWATGAGWAYRRTSETVAAQAPADAAAWTPEEAAGVRPPDKPPGGDDRVGDAAVPDPFTAPHQAFTTRRPGRRRSARRQAAARRARMPRPMTRSRPWTGRSPRRARRRVAETKTARCPRIRSRLSTALSPRRAGMSPRRRPEPPRLVRGPSPPIATSGCARSRRKPSRRARRAAPFAPRRAPRPAVADGGAGSRRAADAPRGPALVRHEDRRRRDACGARRAVGVGAWPRPRGLRRPRAEAVKSRETRGSL